MARFGSIGTQYFDGAGDPLADGKLYFYDSGTTTDKTTYADSAQTIPNRQPVVLDGDGRQPNVFFEGTARAILTNNDDVQIDFKDPVGETISSYGETWDATKSYAVSDVVLDPADGEYYQSLVAANVGNTPSTSATEWKLTAPQTASDLTVVPAGGITSTDVQAALEELDGEIFVPPTTTFEEFTTSGTWTKDANATYVYVEVLGAGGSGAAAESASYAQVSGGAGGDFLSKLFLASDLGATEAITIGAGGAAAVATAGNLVAGSDGGNTSFGSFVTAYGGQKGVASTATAVRVATTTRIGAFVFTYDGISSADVARLQVNEIFGGFGTSVASPGSNSAVDGGKSVYGGGGGAGSSTTGAASRAGGTSDYAGAGGNSTQTTGTAGTYPSGGGGAASDNDGGTKTSGAGANGRVRVWQW